MLDYRVNHIPIRADRRVGRKANMTTLTIHSTANPNSTALNERNWLVNPSNKRTASWHLAVDDKMVVEAIPLDEVAWHSGNSVGNNTSIGIEICESGNRANTIQNAVDVTVALLKERGWNVSHLRRHYDWSGKNCPRIFSANNWQGWNDFKAKVQLGLDGASNVKPIKINFLGQNIILNGVFKNDTNYINVGEQEVPLRGIFEEMGFKVGWNQQTQTILVTM